MPAKTTVPGAGLSRSPRKRAEGLATSSSPSPVISNTPISSAGPKRVLDRAQGYGTGARARLRNRAPCRPCARRRGGRRIWPSFRAHARRGSRPTPVTWRKRTEFMHRRTHLADRARRTLHRVEPHRLDRVDDDEPRGPPFPASSGCCGGSSRRRASPGHREPQPRGAPSAPERSPPRPRHTPPFRPACPEELPPACRRSVDLPIPGSPPTSTADPGTSPPPSTRSELAESVRPFGRTGASGPPRSVRAIFATALRPEGRLARAGGQGRVFRDGVPLPAGVATPRPLGVEPRRNSCRKRPPLSPLAPSWPRGAAPRKAATRRRRGGGVRAGPTRGRRCPTRVPRVPRAASRCASAARLPPSPHPRAPGGFFAGHDMGALDEPGRSGRASVRRSRSIASARATFSSE